MLTDAKVRTLKPKGQRYEVFDGGKNGLALRVAPTGTKTWALWYRLDGRKAPKRLTLGTYPTMSLSEAREEAAKARGRVEKGEDVATAKQEARAAARAHREAERDALTVAGLCKSFLELYAKPRKRSWEEDERKLHVEVAPTLKDSKARAIWDHRKAREITRGDVQALLDAIAARGSPVAANRTKALLSRLFRWALSRGLVDVDPTAGMEALAKERPRDRVLSESEVRTFWKALDACPFTDSTKRALKLVLVTAQRPGEVAGMRFEELAEHDGRVVWTIPGSRRKKDDAHVVPLSALALELVGEWKEKTGPVFPGRDPADPKAEVRPITEGALSYALRRNVGEREEVPAKKKGKKKRNGIPVAHFVVHDLRRTAATLMSGAGVAGLVKPMILGHAARGVTLRTYDLFGYLPEKAAALDAWARRLESITTGKEAPKVIQLRATR